jgi:hypothetical protein
MGSDRWYGTMPIECLVVWIIALLGDREETTTQEELIQEGKKEREKKWKKRESKREGKSTKERKRMRKYADAI